MKLYHSDRCGSIDPAKGFYLRRLGSEASAARSIMEVPTDVSRHGWRYLMEESDSVGIEMAWEMVRQKEFPNCPSRLTSVFCFGDPSTARRLFGADGQAAIWEVDAPDSTLCFDMQLLTNAPITRMVEHARAYWRQESSDAPVWEYLVQTPFGSLRRLPEQ